MGFTGDRTKIDVGGHQVRFGASGSEVDLGFTRDGSEIVYTPSYKEIMVDQVGQTPIDARLTGEVLTAKVNLVEIKQTNLLVAFPAATAASGAASADGMDIGRLSGYSIVSGASGVLILHPAELPAATVTEDWVFPLAVVSSPVSVPRKVDDETVLALEFKAFADYDKPDTQLLARYGHAAY